VPLPFDRYVSQIVAETDLLRAAIAGAELTTPVPSCPGWNVGQLCRHLGGAQRWAAAAVDRRIQEPLGEQEFAFRDLAPYAHETVADLDPWLRAGAEELAKALREAGPGAPMWTPVPTSSTSDFYARRFTHETLVHRADATLALNAGYEADPAIAADAIDEWLELGSLPLMLDLRPGLRDLLGPDRTVHFHATDTDEALDAEWVVDFGGPQITWRRAHEKSAVAVRGPLTELLLLVYRRRSRDTAAVEVFGDEELLARWLRIAAFG
jgi:uncharacterized protein (TIGR03083 family)